MKLKSLALIVAGYGLVFPGCGIEKHNPWRKKHDSDLELGKQWNLHQDSPRGIVPQVEAAVDCAAVESYVKEKLIFEMETTIRNNYKWMLTFSGDVVSADSTGNPQGAPIPVAAGAPPNSAEKGDAPLAFTDTNNQIEGIEEPDTLKTDGTYFYHLTGNQLRVSKAWPATELTGLAVLDFPEYPVQMLMTQNQKLVVFLTRQFYDDQVASMVGSRAESFLPRYQEKVSVYTIDVADPAHPVITARKTLNGNLTGARRVDNQVRVVLSRSLAYPESVQFDFYNELQQKNKFERLNAIESIIARNKTVISNNSLASLVGSSRDGFELTSSDCRSMLLPRMSTPLGVTDIYTTDVDSGEEKVVSLLSRSDGIHGARENLYVSTQYYWWDQESRDTNYFYLHKFSYGDSVTPVYKGTAGMEGNVLNQFSMDEYEGNVRVAATVSQRTSPDSWNQTTFNRIYVVKEYDGYLAVAGMSEPLAKDEQIYGVRFAGKLGYVVTFRRVDPLFVIGFDDPIKPVVLGELKIPGYSTYLHPIADGMLLAVGEEIDEFSQMNIGHKISVYDVSIPAQPTEKFKKVLPPDLYIESVYNHKSFKYHGPSGLLALPSYGGVYGDGIVSEYAYGISLYKIDGSAGIIDHGFLNLAKREKARSGQGYAGPIHAVIADDFVYGIDSLGIKAAKVQAPSGQSWELAY